MESRTVFQRRHFVVVAHALRTLDLWERNPMEAMAVVDRFCDVFQATNPGFNEDLFRDASGWNGTGPKP
jgi:hypothetical protein